MRFSKIISYIFHPLLMSGYGIMFILFTKNHVSTFIPANYKLTIIGITFLFTFILPTLNALILLKVGRIKSLEMETINERIIPYSGAAIYHFALFYLFYNAHFPNIFQILVLGAAASIVITLLITLKWKISAHGVGIGGIVGGILGIMYRLQIDLQLAFILVILFAGIIGYARLKLNAHNPAQVYSGIALGFFVELGLMLFY